MDGLVIKVGWEYFLGIMLGLLGVAWYSNGRFSKLEASMEWVKFILKELKITGENKDTKAFTVRSPKSLTPKGKDLLEKSGIRKYIEENKDALLELCEKKKEANPYEAQQYIFKLFDSFSFGLPSDNELKNFSYEEGISLDIIRRVGAIHFRDLCLDSFGMEKEDIDRHDPTKNE